MKWHRELSAIVPIGLAIALAACGSPSTTPAQTTFPTATDSSTGGESEKERFAMQGEMVLAEYPSAILATAFSGDKDETLSLPATDVAEPVQVVLLLTCTGTGPYAVTVEQVHANTVGATCGTAGTAIAAVPVDAPSRTTTLRVDVPDGSDYWLTAYYTRTDG